MENTSSTSKAIPSTSHGFYYKSVFTFVVIFGILGNILVILSMLRQRRLFKNNFYHVVFHVTICDLSYLLLSVYHLYVVLAGKNLNYEYLSVCVGFQFFRELYLIFGAYFMLVISVIRYRAVLHPLKPAISHGRLKFISCFVYLSTLLISFPRFYMCVHDYSGRLPLAYAIVVIWVRAFIWYGFPVAMMAIIYWKICRELIRQNNAIKSMSSNGITCGTFKRLLHHRNWRTFVMSLIAVVCFAVGGLPRHVSTFFLAADPNRPISHRLDLLIRYGWIIQAAGTCAVNPLIYGILDKKLLPIFKLCQKNPK